MHIITNQEVFKIFSCSIYKSLVTDHNKYKVFFVQNNNYGLPVDKLLLYFKQ